MKKYNILYWVFTILISGLLIFSSIGSVLMTEETIVFMNGYLGYPKYIIPFLGWAKIIGVVAILVPGFPRIKEWAYFGLAMDLAGALFSIASVPVPEGTPTGQAFFGYVFIGGMLVILALSYIYYHKRKGTVLSLAR